MKETNGAGILIQVRPNPHGHPPKTAGRGPATRMVRPDWNGMARELKVNRSTISRVIARLRNSGFIESIGTPTRPGSKIMHISYRLKTG